MKKKLMQWAASLWPPDWRTLLSGILIVLAFPPWDLAPLIWIAIVPWCFALQRCRTHREAAVQGAWLGMFMTLGGYSWVAYAIHNYGNLPWIVSILGLFLFGFICQLQFPVFGAAFLFIQRQLRKRKPFEGSFLISLALASVYTAVDWHTPKLWLDTFGHSFYASPYLRQAADLGGAFLLTFVIVFHNFGLFSLILFFRSRTNPTSRKDFKIVMFRYLGIASLCLLTAAYGMVRSQSLENEIQNPRYHARFAVIQANIGDMDKLAAFRGVDAAAAKAVDTYIALSTQALSHSPRPHVLVWPETAYPGAFLHPRTRNEANRERYLSNFARTNKVHMIFGGYDTNGRQDFNSVFTFTPQPPVGRRNLQVYRKTILLPFGEYIPGFGADSIFKKVFPQMGFFGRGSGVLIHEVPLQWDTVLKTSPMICYEGLFSEFSLEAARLGAEVLINVTNDSWFGTFGEPHLHLALTVFRSVETRLPMVRSTNTGISALILPNGDLAERSEIGKPAVLHWDVPILKPRQTLLMRWGDWFGWLCTATSALLAGFLWWRRKHP